MTPTLSTREVLLTPMTEPSFQHVAMLNDPVNVRFSELRHQDHSLWTSWDHIHSFDRVNDHLWAISRNDAHIGAIAVRYDPNNSVADISILLDHKYQGNGYGTQAWEAVMDWLFHRGVRKIEAGTMAVNTGMIRILDKLGFRMEGTKPEHFLLDGKPVDLVYFGKLNNVAV